MSVITPQTNIKLLKVPIGIDNDNQLTFSNATEQYSYFNSLPKLEFDKCTYQRKDNYMAINEDADTLQKYNYCMYQNEQYDNKWFYAFITNITYEGNSVSYVYIKTDTFQTWQFDLTYKPSFVEREHTNDDTIGANTIPENLELGEFKVNSTITETNLNNDYKVILASTIEPLLDNNGRLIGTDNGGGVYGNIKSGCKYYAYSLTSTILTNVLKAFAEAGKTEAIVGLFMLPSSIAGTNVEGGECPNDVGSSTWQFEKQLNLDGYIPINNKLLTYSYNYLYVTNNNGGNSIYHYEKFSTTNVQFEIDSIITPSGSIILYPRNYNGVTGANYSEKMSGGKYPICAFQNDVYKNWLTQNNLNLTSKLVGGGAMMIGGIVTAATGLGLVAGGAAALGGVAQVFSTLQQINQQKNFTPPQSEGNVNTADVNFSMNLTTFTAYKMSIKSEYARIIDDFFSKFGYKTARVKIPNINGRTNWNYVKTIDINIIGDIPQNDLQEIKAMFNKGLTLWHNPTTFLDYSQSNTIV